MIALRIDSDDLYLQILSFISGRCLREQSLRYRSRLAENCSDEAAPAIMLGPDILQHALITDILSGNISCQRLCLRFLNR